MAQLPTDDIERFITRWQSAGGSERANYQLFVHELCALLALPTPDPAREDTRDNAYVFERRVTFRRGDGAESPGFIDCYCRAWPATQPEQVKAVAEILAAARAPLAEDAIAANFNGRGAWKKRLPQIIDTLVAVGRVRRRKDKRAVIA